MRTLLQFCMLYPLLSSATAFAQTKFFATSEAAIASAFPKQKFVEWTATEGDLNGDGIKDRAMILTRSSDAPQEIRLLVLAGTSAGGYAVLSTSAQYCDAQKFIELEIRGQSLFVAEIQKADGDGSVTNTLQFRFNKKLNDFELVGKENKFESFLDQSSGRTSVNYVTGSATIYERKKNRSTEKKVVRFQPPQLPTLNGFNCEKLTLPY